MKYKQGENMKWNNSARALDYWTTIQAILL